MYIVGSLEIENVRERKKERERKEERYLLREEK